MDGVDPVGGATKEGVKALDVAPFRGDMTPFLLCYSKTFLQSLDKLFGELAGTEHLSHQLRRLRGVRVNHGV